jgi:hypothetical protein
LAVLLEVPLGTQYGQHAHVSGMNAIGGAGGTALLAVGIHTLAMLCVAGAAAIAVYEWVGLAFLRRGWVNLDLVWIIALIGAGLILLGMGLS